MNEVNVFIDGWSNDKEEPRYMLFELYLYEVETEQYELIKITGLKYCPGAPQRYNGIAEIEYHNQIFNLNFEVSFNRTINLNEGVGVTFIDNNETKVIYLVKKN
ncbi:MAG: hypothetical protein NC182_04920 [Prevotella sp.]|nr:hypothetical protein [Staphylococcus sp.]MCM1350526.1 hypothetical protein [Prevotella sp.]